MRSQTLSGNGSACVPEIKAQFVPKVRAQSADGLQVVLSELHTDFRPMLSEWSPGGLWLATVDIFAGVGHIMNSQTGHLAHSWQQPPDIQYSKIWLPSWANDASCCFIPGNSTMLYMADLVNPSLPVRSSAHMSRCGRIMLDSFRPTATQQAGPSTAAQTNNTASLGHLVVVSGQFHAIEGSLLASFLLVIWLFLLASAMLLKVRCWVPRPQTGSVQPYPHA